MSLSTLPGIDPEFAQYLANNPIQLLPVIPMTQDQFFAFCQQNPDWRFERNTQGELIVMPPAGGESSAHNASVTGQLYIWSIRDGTGRVYDSSGGFILPNGANRSPDTSWVLKSRLSQIPPDQLKKFVPLSPDFIVEILSPSDSLKQTQGKMEEYIDNGTMLGWLIVPEKKQVHVYRSGQSVQVFDNLRTVSGDPELPGFVLDLEPVWRP